MRWTQLYDDAGELERVVSVPHVVREIDQTSTVHGGHVSILRRPKILDGSEVRIENGGELYIL